MKRKKLIFEKLNSVPDHDWIVIFDKLTIFAKFKLKGRIIYGAHSEKNLGMDAVNFYIEDAIQKIYENTWDWKFEKYSLLEQLKLVIGSTISENVRKTNVKTKAKAKYEAEAKVNAIKAIELVPTESEKLEFLAEKKFIPDENSEEILNKFNDILVECSKDDPDLELLVLALQETDNSDEIVRQCGWDKKQLYTLQRKLYRRVRNYAEINKIKF